MARTVTITFDDNSQHVYQNVPDTVTPDAIEQRAASEFGKKLKAIDGGKQQKPEPAKEQSFAGQVVAPPVAALETGMALGSGAVGAVAGGLAGLAQGAKNLVSPGMPAGDRVQQVQEALTYQPRTQAGQAVTQAVAYPFEKLAQGADYVGGNVAEATGSPAIGAAANTALQAAPMLAGKILKTPAKQALVNAETKAADLKSINSIKDATLKAARDEGYIVPPSATEGSFLTNRIESVGGKAAIGQDFSKQNQVVTNKIGRREARLAENEPISEGTLAAAREKMAGPYREVSAVSKRAADAFERLKEARRQSQLQWDHFKASRNPEALAKAETFDTRAAMLEKLIEHEAGKAGISGLLDRVREARQSLAKNYDVERALNVGSGDLDARIWGRMLDKGKPLTGGLKTAAQFAEAFPAFAREASGVPAAGVSKLGAAMGAGLGLGGYAAAGPVGIGLSALTLLDTPARGLLSSSLMQKPRTYGPGNSRTLFELATRNPEALSLIPALGNLPKEKP